MTALGFVRYSLKITNPGGLLMNVAATVGLPMIDGLVIGAACAEANPIATPSKASAAILVRLNTFLLLEALAAAGPLRECRSGPKAG